MQLETNKAIIGEKIKKYRKRKQLTQAQLAELVDLNEKQIYRIETGLNHPTYLTFVKLVEVLEININDFTINKKIKTNPLIDEIMHILKNSSDSELRTYIEMLTTLKKHLSEIQNSK